MTLLEKQMRFAFMVAQLISWATTQGYRVTFGEAFRTAEQAKLNAQQGTGISNSLHTKRLAVDLMLFTKLPDGSWRYRTRSEDYLPLGEYWEFLGGSWGGRFSKPDGNHFSLEHEGIR
jgi:hypothetical protein